MKQSNSQTLSRLSILPPATPLLYMKILQVEFWIIGIALLSFMLFMPSFGVLLFWNILIPVAPALLVLGTGLWRNVCPLGTTSLIPDRFGFSKKIKLSNSTQMTFNLIGVIMLLLIIPLRHVIFDRDGHATAFIILSLVSIALLSGSIYERKSAWCSGLCPVHPVEKLYGSGVGFTLPNAHCDECVKCSVPCPDSTMNVKPIIGKKSGSENIAELLLIGGFPGYVWGWFQVPDYIGSEAWSNLVFLFHTFKEML